ncbi:MAG: hypothetical protein MJ108_02425 [Saccharofermentans sp.]|nr:hypothetical protein [Saccharofermentans sp.]
MDITVAIVKTIILIISCIGYYAFLRSKLNIRQEFLPAVIMSSIGVILFVFGCINLLVPAANALLIGGIVLFLYLLIKSDKSAIRSALRKEFTPGIIAFILLGIFLFIRLRDAHIYDGDNFNHWGMIVKNLMFDSAFPDSNDSVIRFQSYPTGSAVLIWYFMRLFSHSDALALFIQDLFMMSCGIGFFTFVSGNSYKRNISGILLSILGTLSMFSCDKYLFNGPFDLLVDQMLASIAVMAFLIMEYYRDDIKKAMMLTLPLLTFEIAVKSSGILFTYAIGVIIAFRIIKSAPNIKRALIPTGIFLITPIIIREIWSIRIKLVFTSANTSIHSVSFSNYKNVMADKTATDIKTITNLYLEKALSMQNYIVTFMLILFVLFALFEYKKNKNLYRIKNSAIYILIVYIIYQVGLYCMYIFSMPVYEALVLPCYFRYIMTIDQFTLGIVLLILIQICSTDDMITSINNKPTSTVKILGILFSVVMLMVYSIDNISPLFVPREKTEIITVADLLYSIYDKYQLPQDQEVSYLIYISDVEDDEFYQEDRDYKWNASRYALYSSEVHTLRKNQLATFTNLRDFDYFIVIYPDDEIKEYLRNNSISYSECIDLRS